MSLVKHRKILDLLLQLCSELPTSVRKFPLFGGLSPLIKGPVGSSRATTPSMRVSLRPGSAARRSEHAS